MTKSDIAEKIQTETGLSKKESAELMEAVFSLMLSDMANISVLLNGGCYSNIVAANK